MTGVEHDLRDALRESGCPVCRILRSSEARYWGFFLYEGFQDPQATLELRRSIGYCRRHLAQLAERRDAFASAVLAQASVEGALLRLEGRQRRRRRSNCPVCRSLLSVQEIALQVLCHLAASDGAFAGDYRHTDGICFDHLDCVPERRRDGGLVLQMHAREVLAARLQDVRRLKKSFDYRSDPPSAELARAWRRAFRSLRDEPGRITG